jgi:sugar lactone lactonase YvrE
MRSTMTVADGIYFGEGPRWHDGHLWFSDFFAHAIKRFDPATGAVDVALTLPDGGRPSGLGWLPDGRLLFVSMLDRAVMRLDDDGAVRLHADLSGIATFHTNDMVVGPTGRAYVGNFGFDLDETVRTGGPAALASAPTAVLARVEPDGSVHVAAEGMRFPNGTVLSPDGATLIVAESMGGCLTAFTVAGDGTLSDRRVFAATPGAAPDGICLDAEGAVWVANAFAPEVRRYADGGELLEVVTTSEKAFACMLGGEDRSTLYVLTARNSSADEASLAPTGRLEAVAVEVPGAGWP